MRKSLLRITVLLFFSLIMLQTADSKVKWKLNKQKAGINNYIAPVEGSKYNQYMAVGIINAKAETILELLRDVPGYMNWLNSCKKNKLIKNNGNDNLIVYYMHDATFPVSDRDTIVKTRRKFELNRGKAKLYIDSVKYPAYPLNKKCIEMDFHVLFDCTYIDRDHTRVVFTLKFSPGGKIKSSLVDFDTKYLPLKSLLNMRKIVKQPKYIAKGKKCKELPLILNYYKKIGK